MSELYPQIEQFYATQMQLLDDGAVQEWADTFTHDGVFEANAHPEPARGREAIASAAKRTVAELAEQGLVRRHWIGMLSVRPNDDGSVGARSYAVVLQTPKGGQAAIRFSTVCEDVLVRRDGGWQVLDRRVSRDDLT